MSGDAQPKRCIWDVYVGVKSKAVCVVHRPHVLDLFGDEMRPVYQVRAADYYEATARMIDLMSKRWRVWRYLGTLLFVVGYVYSYALLSDRGHAIWAALVLLFGHEIQKRVSRSLRVHAWRGPGNTPDLGTVKHQ